MQSFLFVFSGIIGVMIGYLFFKERNKQITLKRFEQEEKERNRNKRPLPPLPFPQVKKEPKEQKEVKAFEGGIVHKKYDPHEYGKEALDQRIKNHHFVMFSEVGERIPVRTKKNDGGVYSHRPKEEQSRSLYDSSRADLENAYYANYEASSSTNHHSYDASCHSHSSSHHQDHSSHHSQNDCSSSSDSSSSNWD